jgi:hypothetical protein
MTRKDYQLIARSLARVKGNTPTRAHEIARIDVALALATDLANANPAFDRDIFLKACGAMS